MGTGSFFVSNTLQGAYLERIWSVIGGKSWVLPLVRVESLSENNSEGFSFLLQAGDIDLPIPLPPHPFLDTKKCPPSP